MSFFFLLLLHGQAQIYERYEQERLQQIDDYKKTSAVRQGTCCRALGCRRFFGRKGFFFCTEGCDHCDRTAGEPSPPPDTYDFEDDCDASTVLARVLGPPPPNVIIRRWRYDQEKTEYVLETFPEKEEVMMEETKTKEETKTSAPFEEISFEVENKKEGLLQPVPEIAVDDENDAGEKEERQREPSEPPVGIVHRMSGITDITGDDVKHQ